MSDVSFINESLNSRADSVPGVRSSVRSNVLRLYDRFVFGSVVAVTVTVAIPYGTVEQWWISLYECAIFLLAGLWMVDGFVRGSWDFGDGRLIAPVAALAVFAYVQTVALPFGDPTSSDAARTISADPFETRLTCIKLVAFVLNGALLLRYACSARRIKTLIHFVIGVAVVSALFGLVRQTLQTSESGFVLPYLRSGSGFGQFVNKNHFALLMEMSIGLAAGLIFAGGVKRERLLFYISAVVLMWTGLVMTSSRGGILTMCAQGLFMLALIVWSRKTVGNRRKKEKSTGVAARPESLVRWRRVLTGMALGGCLLTVLAVSAVFVGGDLLVTRLRSLPGEIRTEAPEPYAGSRRREVWSATWNLIKAHPFLGSGFGAYEVAITKFHDASGKWTPEAAHNDYLEVVAAGGLVGTGLVAWFAIAFIKRARQRLYSRDIFSRAACIGALTGIFGVLVHNAVDFGLHVTANAVMFIVLVVVVTNTAAHKRKYSS
jgi:O-antigen ligase